jgi:hypothetical protein
MSLGSNRYKGLCKKLSNATNKWAVFTTTFFGLIFVFASPALAQLSTGDVLGTVSDPTGSVISNATVILTSIDTGARRSVQTDNSGEFAFSALQPGHYSLDVSAAGFSNFALRSFVLAAGDRNRQNISMRLGAQSEVVQVTSVAPLLDTDTSALSMAVNEKQAQDLPLNGRNFVQLAQLAPGANEGTPGSIANTGRPDDRRQTSSISANAQSDTLNNELVDGMDNNEGTVGTIGVRPSVEAIAEFRAYTSNYPAEVGKTGGAIVNIITKAGSNALHGSAYEFIRNDVFDGRNFFARTGRRPEFRQNQFGASLGGPVRRDKTFFFGDYEGFRIISAGTTYVNTVPTLFEQQNPGNFTDIGGPIIVPNATALNFFALYPHPDTPTGNTFTYSPKGNQYSSVFDGRVDHYFSPNNQLFGRYAYNNVDTFTPGSLPAVNGVEPAGSASFPGSAHQRAQQLLIDYLHIFSPKTLIEAKAGYTRILNASYPLNYKTNLASKFGIPNANVNDFTSMLPNIGITGYTGFGGSTYLPLIDLTNTFQYSASLTRIQGSHTIKAGVALLRRQVLNQQNSAGAGSYSFNGNYSLATYKKSLPLVDFLAGRPYGVSRVVQLFPRYVRSWEPSLYVQDDWRVNHNLTLNLGIRYDMWTPYKERYGHISQFDASTGTILVANQNSSDTTKVHTQYASIAPRFGFTANVRPNTVIRGGFGISYFRDSTGPTVPFAGPPYTATYSPGALSVNLSDPLPSPVAQSTTNLTGAQRGIDPNFKNSYVEQFGLNVEQSLRNTVFTVGYIGSLTKHVRIAPDINLAAPQLPAVANTNDYATRRPFYSKYPNLNASINILQSGGFGNYNSLQATVQHRYDNGITAQANYTYAHALNDTQGFSQGGLFTSVVPSRFAQLEYGNSDLDVRHRFTMLLNYQLPFGKHLQGVKGAIAKGWQVNAIDVWMSGFPFSVVNSAARTNTGAGSDRPDQLRPANISNPSISKWFDTSAFAAQTFGTVGTARRDSVYGPHYRHFDTSIFKDFHIQEKYVLQLRAEAFNVTNTPNFANPGATLGTSSFGVINATRNATTPRQLQFALRLTF